MAGAEDVPKQRGETVRKIHLLTVLMPCLLTAVGIFLLTSWLYPRHAEVIDSSTLTTMILTGPQVVTPGQSYRYTFREALSIGHDSGRTHVIKLTSDVVVPEDSIGKFCVEWHNAFGLTLTRFCSKVGPNSSSA